MSPLLPLIVTILASCQYVNAACYYDSWGYRRCNYLPIGARIGLAVGLFVLGLLIIILMFYHRRRRLANRNAILLQQQQQQQHGRPAQWGALNGVTQYNANPPYGPPPGPPYGQQPQYATPYGGGGGYQYPAPGNTNAFPNNQQAPYVYSVTTPAINTKGYEVSNDTPTNLQPPARAYDPSQMSATPVTNANPNANNIVDTNKPPEYTGYQPPSGTPFQMPNPTGASQNPEGYGSNNPYVYSPPNQTKS